MAQKDIDAIEAENSMNFMDVYSDAQVVGYGSFGIVIAGRIRETREPVALKIAAFDKEFPSQAAKSLMREQSIMSGLDHPNIVKLAK